MPVTPFHFGPGGLVAVVSRGSVSFLAYCASNVLIDVESLYNMVTHQPRIHTYLHTYMGSTLAASFVVASFFALRSAIRPLPNWRILQWRSLRATAVVSGALIGAWSHVLLDSVMHRDITPWAPVSEANGMLGVIPLGTLHSVCLWTGVASIGWWLLRFSTSMERSRDR